MKRICLKLVGLLVAISSASVFAGPCQTTGGVKIFDVSYTRTISTPDMNSVTAAANDYHWNNGSSYSAKCECTARINNTPIHYKSESALPVLPAGTLSGSNQWFVIPNDKGQGNLAVAMQIYIAGQVNKNVYVPFTLSNGNSSDLTCHSGKTDSITVGTGKTGVLSFKIIKPFIGRVSIPRVKVVDLYGSTNNSFSSTPIASVYVSGNVTVPQSCQINDSKAIEVPFGDIAAKDILVKGQGPIGFNKKQITVDYKCTNIADKTALELTMEAVPVPGLANVVATDNPDIGVMVGDQNLNPFIPHITKIPVTFSSQTQRGSTTLYAWPVNTTGNRPQRGPFSATASLNINLK